jgi:streptogramin lyase
MEVGRITTGGVITEYPTPNAPFSITAGPDGALWFTEPAAHQIGRITTSGAITEYGIPCCDQPLFITAGPDRALWFTETGFKIGRITTTGGVTEYFLPAANGHERNITAGPDAALWFLDPCPPGNDQIGRITTAGVFTEYPRSPSCRNSIDSLVAGPDGALWYVVGYPVSIGRITTAGVVTEYPIPSWEVAFSLTRGADGALWYLFSDYEGTSEGLGRITTSGVITEYSLPVSLNPANSLLTSGPDGALWIAEGGAWNRPVGTFVRIALGSGLTITTTSLPGGAAGAPYSATLTAAGGTAPYTWSITSGTVPAGVALNPSTGVISGIPTGGGPYYFTVGVADSSVPPQTAVQAFSISISNLTSTFSIASSPTGLSVSVDGVVYTTPHTFNCNVASQHILTVTTPQSAGISGGRYAFTTWSDGVTTPGRQINCTSSANTYQSNFTLQYLLTTAGSPAGAGSIAAGPASPGGFYNSGASVQLTATANFLNWSGDLSGSANPQSLVMNGPKSVTANFAVATPPSGAATFVKTDGTTSGSWRGVYGADGYNVIGDASALPSYVTVTPAGNSFWSWTSSTSDTRALQKVSNPVDRIAACWYGWGSFTIDLAFNDAKAHQVSLYLLDWDIYGGGRTERVDILDANGNVLDTRSVSSFVNGQYLVWNLSGHVLVRITNTNLAGNAVVSGLFFGAGGATGGSSGTASFVKTDATTSGFWKGVYGTDGYNAIGDSAAIPAYVTATPVGNAFWPWASSTADPRALQKASNPFDRIAACWYGWGSFTIDLAFQDSNSHQVALYLLDWDIYGGGRSERVDILDAKGNMLDTRSASSFVDGQYLVWNLSGHVLVRITNTNPAGNAVVSGLFFR